ncbi:MAG TPA: formate dehydrogenase, partial [Variovorax sp.]
DGGWCWVESQWGRVRCMLRYSEAVEPGTVWTWNAIGKADGAWQLAPGADEARKGFLLNHLITEELPFAGAKGATTVSNSDPVTGQAGWYDVRVRIRPAEPEEPQETFPQIASMPAAPGVLGKAANVLTYFAGRRK